MRPLSRLGLLVVPIAIFVAVAIVRLNSLNRQTRATIEQHFTNNTLLVIAHPDDETMFFGPLVLSLVEADKHLEILCLSHGGSKDLGQQRAREMESVVAQLGPKAKLKIVSDPKLPDGLGQEWSAAAISSQIVKHLSSMENRNNNGHTIVTFDSYGVSGHPNHRAIFNALHGKPKHFGGRLLHLESVNMMRKYISFFDVLISHLPRLSLGLGSKQNAKQQHISIGLNFSQNRHLRGLLAGHKSQMVWFRRLYSMFSRYMFVNDFSM